ncbi:MAG: DUF971 domain-containing protein [Balneolales bacterium]
MEKKYTIKNITVHQDAQKLAITWQDNHESIYPLEGLRRACPCVFCQGGHENMGKPVDPEIFKTPPSRTWKINDMKITGNYAIQIIWDDGHQTGIYRFDKLRNMCPVENGVSV